MKQRNYLMEHKCTKTQSLLFTLCLCVPLKKYAVSFHQTDFSVIDFRFNNASARGMQSELGIPLLRTRSN